MLCSIIKHNKENYKIAAIKISPNFHTVHTTDTIIEKGEGFNIYKENELTSKDTSLFLQAGAKQSYYIETEDQYIGQAFNIVLQHIGNDHLIVCESGKLANFIKPGLMIFINSKEEQPSTNIKKTNRQLADLILNVSKDDLDFYIEEINQKIMVVDAKWILK